MLRLPLAAILTALLAAPAAASAAIAPTTTTAVSASDGSADAVGKPVKISAGVEFKGSSQTNLPPAILRIHVATPAGFAYHAEGLMPCDPAKLDADGPAGCPPESQIGVGSATYVFKYGAAMADGETSDFRVFITGPNTLGWYLASHSPVEYSGTTVGSIDPATDGFGSVITFDGSKLLAPQDANDPQMIYLKSFKFDFQGTGVAAQSQAAHSADKCAKRPSLKLHPPRTLRSNDRAKVLIAARTALHFLKRKDGKPYLSGKGAGGKLDKTLGSALLRFAREKGLRHPSRNYSAAVASALVSAVKAQDKACRAPVAAPMAQARGVFNSGACPQSGLWHSELRLDYQDGTSAKPATDLPCSAAAPAPAPAPAPDPAPMCTLGLPVCSAGAFSRGIG